VNHARDARATTNPTEVGTLNKIVQIELNAARVTLLSDRSLAAAIGKIQFFSTNLQVSIVERPLPIARGGGGPSSSPS